MRSRFDIRDTSVDHQHACLQGPDAKDERVFRHKDPFTPTDSLGISLVGHILDIFGGHEIGPSARSNLI